MKDYQTEDTRLVNIFKLARDKWKQKALLRQKKLRALSTKVRDTNLSRDKWKEKALTAQEHLAHQETILKEKDAEIERLKKKIARWESLPKNSTIDNNSP